MVFLQSLERWGMVVSRPLTHPSSRMGEQPTQKSDQHGSELAVAAGVMTCHPTWAVVAIFFLRYDGKGPHVFFFLYRIHRSWCL